ncbi:MAG: hypothetical protein RI556_06900 [Hydrogenovibrio sp.]|uniref:hypothetical protein n=1 Tax=Hydrogenovibrio sp. TaxID=2065821 RepID=UPI002870A357|nr:hypothetical protein [Hydrogenovibrio sp.]MDR9498885.1 hypothetical protein [Hydrogenovibrio sp.]
MSISKAEHADLPHFSPHLILQFGGFKCNKARQQKAQKHANALFLGTKKPA